MDFDRREIRVRQAYVKGVIGKPKTQESNRDIAMSPWVYEALQAQYKVTHGRSKFVFCNREGEPLDYHNVNRKV
ncbi:hypothetical protein NL488_28575, partial [Klebsiella pneumoniae]|nr:hypothetical protein [Klebsiella pneumoniae]